MTPCYSSHLVGMNLLLLVLGVSAPVVSAQTLGSFSDLPSALASGDSITVADFDGQEQTGLVVDILASALVLLIDGERHDVDQQHVKTIHQWRRDDSVLTGLLSGAAIGAGLGSLSFQRTYDVSNAGVIVALLAAGGAGLGAALDALLPARRLIYRSPGQARRLTVVPLLAAARRGISVSLRF